jgi:hypothetical protein
MSWIQSGLAGRWRLAMGYALAQISPGVAAPGFDVNKSPPWLPLPQTGDGFRRDIQRVPDVLLRQRLAYGITLVVVPAAREREQLRFKIR